MSAPERDAKGGGRLARALVTARIAAAVVSPMSGAAPVPSQTAPNAVDPVTTSQRVQAKADGELAKAQDIAQKERRRHAAGLGRQLKAPEVVQQPPERRRQGR